MRSIFPIFKNFQGISPDFNPKNGHPSCHLGFDSSDVEARRGSTSLDLVEPRLEAGTPLITCASNNRRKVLSAVGGSNLDKEPHSSVSKGEKGY